MIIDDWLGRAIAETTDATERLKAIDRGQTYTLKELGDIRKVLLRSVRDDLDPQMGHMPDKRHY